MKEVYLIEDTINGLYKIGVAKNSQQRIRKLQTGNPNPLKLLYRFETEYPFRMENMIHNRYKHYHVLNEWYDLPIDIVVKFNEICREINDIIIMMKDNVFFGKNLK